MREASNNIATAVEDLDVRHSVPLSKAVLRSTEGRIGLGLALIMLLLIALGPLLAPYDPAEVNAGLPLSSLSGKHLLGTDNLGRDVFSRFLHGGGSVLLIPLAAITISALLGGAMGLLSAYKGGGVDELISRMFDIFLVIPPLLIALLLIAGFKASDAVIVATVGIVFIPRIGRLVRSSTKTVVRKDYVKAAELRGESQIWILFREILPNVAGPFLSAYALFLTYAIIFVATLSFLGLGAQPPSSDWGLMVAQSQSFVFFNVWATIAPALGIAGMSVAFTLIADAASHHLARGADRGGSGL